MLNKNLLGIFSFPRAGTKLIAEILRSEGYHVHGEWYDVWSSNISNQVAHRKSPEQIASEQKSLFNDIHSTDYLKLSETIHRHNTLQIQPRSVITVWYENAINFPWLFMQLNDHYWICPRRNLWDQLTSFMVSWHNNNFNAHKVSQPITVDLKWFEIFFWRWHYIRKMQSWLVDTGRGTWVDFDRLITGTEVAFGKKYTVSSIDEHHQPESLITNLDMMRERYVSLLYKVTEMDKNIIDSDK